MVVFKVPDNKRQTRCLCSQASRRAVSKENEDVPVA